MKLTQAAVLTGLTAALLWGADGRRKLWDLDLSKLTNHQAKLVWGIRFSPDETKVAIGFGSNWDFDPDLRHVVVVAVDQPRTVLRDFELDIPGLALPFSRSIVWSPSATILVAANLAKPLMLRLDGKAPCVFPEDSTFGGFLSGDRMALSVRASSRKDTPTEIRILNPDCSVADSWKTNGLASLNDTSPERDLLAIGTSAETKGQWQTTIELVDSRKQEVQQRWTWNSFVYVLFADQGRLVCHANPRQEEHLPDVACWDTRTGARAAENQGVALGMEGLEGLELSAGGGLLAMTDYRYISREGRFWQILDMSSYSVPKRELIWNVRTGKEVASWGASQQEELRGRDFTSAQTRKTNFVLSLSPTGKYVAEGGSGSVSIYAVRP